MRGAESPTRAVSLLPTPGARGTRAHFLMAIALLANVFQLRVHLFARLIKNEPPKGGHSRSLYRE